MQNTSALYKALRSDPTAREEVKVTIAGEDYGEDRLVSVASGGGIFAGDTLCVGSAVSKEIDLVIYSPGTIPRMAEIKPFFRLTNGTETSEWIQKGVYYIDTRKPDNEADTLTIHGFDAMLKGEKVWEPDQALEFPMNMRAAALEMARLMGVELEKPEDIREDYFVDYPTNGYTRRNILQFIAAAHGGNFTMSDLGNLRLIKLNSLPDKTDYLVTEDGDAITFGGVRILVE